MAEAGSIGRRLVDLVLVSITTVGLIVTSLGTELTGMQLVGVVLASTTPARLGAMSLGLGSMRTVLMGTEAVKV